MKPTMSTAIHYTVSDSTAVHEYYRYTPTAVASLIIGNESQVVVV